MLGVVPLWFVSTRNSRDLYSFTRALTPNDREREYLRILLTRRDTAQEVRAFDTAGFLRRRYDRLYDGRIAELGRWRAVGPPRSLLGALASSALTALTAGVLALLFISDRMPLAAAGTAIFGLYQLGNRLRALQSGASSLVRGDAVRQRLHLLPAARAGAGASRNVWPRSRSVGWRWRT